METKKVKTFPPSLKEKNRYLLIKGNKELFFKIQKEFLGLVNYSKANFKIIDEKNEFFLVKCNVKVLDLIRASFCLYKGLKIIKIFGTIKKYKKFIENLDDESSRL
jgi:RNase P/RNase MRP subunit POP5